MLVSVSEEIDRTHNPKLTKGRIVGISGDNYIVELLGNQYTISSVSGAKHRVNEVVWVCKPYGENTEQFILGGEITDKTTVGTVLSVNNKEGNVVLDKADIGLNNVDNTSDLKKPISIETQTALDNKVDKVSGKQLSDENYTLAEKTKLESIENNANDYTHPTTHPSTMITGLTKVANTGDYNDLINKPLILNGKDGTDGYTPIKGIDYFDGKDGTDGINGKDGERGDSGITVPLNTFFSMYVKANGDLIAVVADGGAKPPLSIKNGNLIYTI